MQFQFNSDYPGLTAESVALGTDVGVASANALASDPKDFPPAQPIPCARITTRIYHPSRNEVSTVQNVLVRTMTRAPPQQQQQQHHHQQTPSGRGSDDNSSISSEDYSASSSSSCSDVDMADGSTPAFPPPGQECHGVPAQHQGGDDPDRAYWIQRTLREAIYGRVLFATVLRRRYSQYSLGHNNINADWEVTAEFCAVKEMSRQLIRKERDRLAEDPIKEVSAMQYLKRWHQLTHSNSPAGISSKQAVMETHVMMPLDLLSDDRNLYSIMPYCDGGELFERLDLNERFSEDEARYWMHQVLTGLENLQNAGVCHRDMSLENLLVHQNRALVIDLGMCLRVPLKDDTAAAALSASLSGMNMNSANLLQIPDNTFRSGRVIPRSLIRPQGTCGKWIYMSPEIYLNRDPFDGYAVDMWAAGVILFLMLTGFPPWERACATDERFKYMTAGYLVQMLTEWDLGLSSDAMDLLQRMLFLDPKDRLSLDQVRAHPWMLTGQVSSPSSFPIS